MKTLYDIDEKESIKASYKNPSVIETYGKYTARKRFVPRKAENKLPKTDVLL